MHIVTTTLSLLLLATAASAAPSVSFAKKPTLAHDGDKVKIEFAVSAATDAEVAILDAEGKVVRHLAAGAISEKTAGAFPAGLSQSLTWDGKDDQGKPTKAASVRVLLGAQPKLDKIVGWDGNSLGGMVNGLAVGKGGELFALLSHGNRGASSMRVFSRDGKYLRTVMPYPAWLPKERTAQLGQLEVDGERLPIIYNAHGGNILPMTNGFTRQNMAFGPQGHMVLASALGSMEEHGPPRYMLALAPDGGAPKDVNFIGPKLRDEIGMMGGTGESGTRLHECVVFSPDGQFVYYSASRIGEKKPRHVVFRMKWTDPRVDKVFLGEDGVKGSDDAHFDNPAGIATDKAGNLYVCDHNNNRVMCFGPDGKKLDSFEVKDPEQIAINPASGEFYVLSKALVFRTVGATIRKFSARGKESPKELAKLELGSPPEPGKDGKKASTLSGKGTEFIVMALDAEAAPAKLWIGDYRQLYTVQDAGNELKVGESILNTNGLGPIINIGVDPVRNRLYVHDVPTGKGPIKAVDLATGNITRLLAKGEAPTVDRDGNIYVSDGYVEKGTSLSRYTPDGKPLPFAATGSNKLDVGYYRGFGPDIGCGRGICIAPDGDLYFLRSGSNGLEDGNPAQVDVWSPDGKLKKAKLLDGVAFGDCGLGVDAAGNIYLGSNLKPKGQPLPDYFVGKASPEPWRWWKKKRETPWFYAYANPYLSHLGSVLKFGPQGGVFYGRVSHNLPEGKKPPRFDLTTAPKEALEFMDGYLELPVKVSGMLWRNGGMYVPHSNLSWGDPGCCCTVSQMGVDEYGRVFAPNIFRFGVEMLDTAGNLLMRIGRYGNADATDAEISFARPLVVTVAGGKLYVADPASQRISVISFSHAAEETVALP